MKRRYLSDAKKIELEKIVDYHDLEAVLVALSEIAFAKADHILETYQDRSTAAVWTHDARLIERAATKIKSP